MEEFYTKVTRQEAGTIIKALRALAFQRRGNPGQINSLINQYSAIGSGSIFPGVPDDEPLPEIA